MSFDERRFRDALGAFATGVAIITGVTEEGMRLGMTVSSFSSVSITPPLVLFSLARRAHSFAAWCKLRRYAINVLSQEQERLSNRFARSHGDKWSGVIVMEGETGLPLFPNALAAFECNAYARCGSGDHDIFVGRVLSFRTNAGQLNPPLIFFGGNYRRIDAGLSAFPPDGATFVQGWWS